MASRAEDGGEAAPAGMAFQGVIKATRVSPPADDMGATQ